MRIFVSEMKKEIIIVAYWLAVIFLTALLLTSLDYDLWQAILMSLSFLPAAMARRKWSATAAMSGEEGMGGSFGFRMAE